MVESVSQQVGRYELIALLGEGGMARAYLALTRGPAGFNKVVVVKQIIPDLAQDADFVAMFLDEARLAARLHHPNIVQTFDVAEYDGAYVLVMEYLEGQSLASILKRLHPTTIPLETHLWLLSEVLTGLHYAHTLCDYSGSPLGVVHRDVSPGNVLVTYGGEVKLLDFGVAKARCALAPSIDKAIKGKVGYCAPEQLRTGDHDARADVFAVGVMLWEVLAGQRRRRGTSLAEAARARLDGDEPTITEVRPDIDPELARICDRATAMNPADRYATAAEFQTALRTHLDRVGTRGRQLLVQRMEESFAMDRRDLRRMIDKRLTTEELTPSGERGSRTLNSPGSSRSAAALAPVDAALSLRPRRRYFVPAVIIGGAAVGAVAALWWHGSGASGLPAAPAAARAAAVSHSAAPPQPAIPPQPAGQPGASGVPVPAPLVVPVAAPSTDTTNPRVPAHSAIDLARRRKRAKEHVELPAVADVASVKPAVPEPAPPPPPAKKRNAPGIETHDEFTPGNQLTRPSGRAIRGQLDERDPYSP
jgi:serine/threonine-protein kinase